MTRRQRLWQFLRKYPGFVGVCFVAAGEAAMNAIYGWNMGKVYAGAEWVFALCLLGNECVKWMTAEKVGQAWEERDAMKGLLAGLLLVAALSISLPAHLGFIGLSRGDATAERTKDKQLAGSASKQLDQAQAARDKIGPVRPVGSIVIDRDNAKKDSPKWQRHEKERLAAVEANRLDGEIAAIEAKLGGRKAVGSADPQVAVLGWITTADEETRKMWLAIALAVGMELVTSVGFIVFGAAGKETMDLEVMIATGVMGHPGSDQVLPFRSECLERRSGAVTRIDDVFALYERWAKAQSKTVMSRPAFLRLIEALGVRRSNDVFLGWVVNPSALLRLVS